MMGIEIKNQKAISNNNIVKTMFFITFSGSFTKSMASFLSIGTKKDGNDPTSLLSFPLSYDFIFKGENFNVYSYTFIASE